MLGCYSQAESRIGSGVTSSASMTLWSAGGEVVVELDQASVVAAAVPYNETVLTAADKLSGIYMRRADAARFMSEYGKNYGDQGSTGDAIILIHVRSVGGMPPTRWIYTTRPLYLYVNPAYLAFLTLGMLRPNIIHEVVEFLDDDCDLGVAYPVDSVEYNATVYQLHAKLVKALHSSAWSKSDVRGLLVMQDEMEDSTNALRSMTYPAFSFNYENVAGVARSTGRIVYEDQSIAAAVLAGVVISCVVGVLVGGLIEFWLRRTVRNWYDQHLKDAEARMNMVLVRQRGLYLVSLVGAERTKAIDKIRAEVKARVIPSRTVSTYEMYTQLVLTLIRDFLLWAFVDSLNSFFRNRVVSLDPSHADQSNCVRRAASSCLRVFLPKMIANRVSRVSPLEPESSLDSVSTFVYIRHLFREYELYCLAHGLQIQTSRATFQRRLALEESVKIVQLKVQRLNSVRWRRREWRQPATTSKPDASTSTTAHHSRIDAPTSGARAEVVETTKAEESSQGVKPAANENTVGGIPIIPQTVGAPAVAAANGGSMPGIAQFVQEELICTNNPADFIDMKTRRGPDGAIRQGLREGLRDWAHEQKRKVPSLNGNWQRYLPRGVLFKADMSVRQIYGIKLREEKDFPYANRLCAVDSAAVALYLLFTVAMCATISMHASLLPSHGILTDASAYSLAHSCIGVSAYAGFALSEWYVHVAKASNMGSVLTFDDIFQPVPFADVGNGIHSMDPILATLMFEPVAFAALAILYTCVCSSIVASESSGVQFSERACVLMISCARRHSRFCDR